MKKKTLAIDFDGVIAHTEPAKAKFAREELGLNLEERLMKQRHFIELFGMERGVSLYSQIIDGVCASERMLIEVGVVAKAGDSIAQLRESGWHCIVVTSRHRSTDDDSDNSQAEWAWRFLKHHRFQISRNDFFPIGNQSKLDICLHFKACALVDDDYLNLLPIINAGIEGYLFSSVTNISDEQSYQPFLATRVAGWIDLVEKLHQQFI